MKKIQLKLKLHWIPVILTGIFVLWFGLRTTILRQAIASKLKAKGIEAKIGEVNWKGMFDVQIAAIDGKFAHGGILNMQQLDLHLRPCFSFSGRDWLGKMNVGAVDFAWKGLWANGKGGWQKGKGKFEGKMGYNKAAKAALCIQFEEKPARKHLLSFQMQDLRLNHRLIAADEKHLTDLEGQIVLSRDGEGQEVMQKGSFAKLGEAFVELEGKFAPKTKKIGFRAVVPAQSIENWRLPIQNLGDSSLQGLDVAGEIAGHFAMQLDLNALESLQLECDLNAKGLEIRNFGHSKLDLLIAKTKAKENRLAALPQLLAEAIVLSEDANFWHHQGFDRAIIEQALVENLQKRRFVRGAGTIPMQLLRNQCLHQGKQIDRKVSEVALTWLWEQASPPDRPAQLALYLDTIEWGPNIYGIDQASRFYFHKTPPQLKLDEMLFLCMIVPNPKQYRKVFDANGELDPFAQAYFESMKWLLYEAELIEEDALDAPVQVVLKPQVKVG